MIAYQCASPGCQGVPEFGEDIRPGHEPRLWCATCMARMTEAAIIEAEKQKADARMKAAQRSDNLVIHTFRHTGNPDPDCWSCHVKQVGPHPVRGCYHCEGRTR